jgi:hypothetical protein
MAVGAGLQLGALREGPRLAAALMTIRHLVLPAWALALVTWLALPPAQQAVIVAFAALPTASSAYVLAVRMGGHGRLHRWSGDGVHADRHGGTALVAGRTARHVRVDRRAGPMPSRCARAPVRRPFHAWPQGLRQAAFVPMRARHCPAPPPGCAASGPADAADGAAFGAAQEVGLAPAPQRSSWPLPSPRASKSGSGLRCANLFHGQASWQSSQP